MERNANQFMLDLGLTFREENDFQGRAPNIIIAKGRDLLRVRKTRTSSTKDNVALHLVLCKLTTL